MKKKMAWVKGANYVLGIIKSTETYDNLKENLTDIRTESGPLKGNWGWQCKIQDLSTVPEYSYDVTKIKPGLSLISIVGRQGHARKLLTILDQSNITVNQALCLILFPCHLIVDTLPSWLLLTIYWSYGWGVGGVLPYITWSSWFFRGVL